MKKIFKSALAALLIVPTLALGLVAVAPAPYTQAFDGGVQEGANAAKGSSTGEICLFTGQDGCGQGIFTTVVNILLFLIGAIAVIMLIIGGVRYTVSGGDSGNVTAAKNTILYAIIGIVVAVLAYAIVDFVIGGLIQ